MNTNIDIPKSIINKSRILSQYEIDVYYFQPHPDQEKYPPREDFGYSCKIRDIVMNHQELNNKYIFYVKFLTGEPNDLSYLIKEERIFMLTILNNVPEHQTYGGKKNKKSKKTKNKTKKNRK